MSEATRRRRRLRSKVECIAEPHARAVSATASGDMYSYVVDKFWRVVGKGDQVSCACAPVPVKNIGSRRETKAYVDPASSNASLCVTPFLDALLTSSPKTEVLRGSRLRRSRLVAISY